MEWFNVPYCLLLVSDMSTLGVILWVSDACAFRVPVGIFFYRFDNNTDILRATGNVARNV